MRNLLLIFLSSPWLIFAQIPQPNYNQAFLQNEVANVFISIDSDSLNLLLGDSLYSGHEFMAAFSYESSTGVSIYDSIGFRARGNTSLASQKKSFKIDFNRFVSGQKYEGLEVPLSQSPDSLICQIRHARWGDEGGWVKREEIGQVEDELPRSETLLSPPTPIHPRHHCGY